MLASEALAAQADGNTDAARYVSLARFFAENITVQAGALERTVTESASWSLRRMRCCWGKGGHDVRASPFFSPAATARFPPPTDRASTQIANAIV